MVLSIEFEVSPVNYSSNLISGHIMLKPASLLLVLSSLFLCYIYILLYIHSHIKYYLIYRHPSPTSVGLGLVADFQTFIRSGSSRKIVIKIIAQMRESSMYLPAVQEIPYLNRNATILSRICMIESFYNCYHVAWFSTIWLGFFSDMIGPCEDKQMKILQNE